MQHEPIGRTTSTAARLLSENVSSRFYNSSSIVPSHLSWKLCPKGAFFLGKPENGSLIQDHLGHAASKEPKNPFPEWIHRLLWCTLDQWSVFQIFPKKRTLAVLGLSRCEQFGDKKKAPFQGEQKTFSLQGLRLWGEKERVTLRKPIFIPNAARALLAINFTYPTLLNWVWLYLARPTGLLQNEDIFFQRSTASLIH